MGVELRPAESGDVGVIARIWREGWADAHLGHVPDELVAARTPESFVEWARGHVADTTVAVRDAAVIGFVIIDGDQVDHLYLDRAARGGGIGSMLLQEARRLIFDAGHSRAWLAVATGNVAARGFYERQGWIDEGAFEHHAPLAGGYVAVDCHRFVSPRTEGNKRG